MPGDIFSNYLQNVYSRGSDRKMAGLLYKEQPRHAFMFYYWSSLSHASLKNHFV